MSLYRVSGIVEAPDGTSYAPAYFGDLETARRVFEAVADGARDRGEAFDLDLVRVDTGGVVRSWSGSPNPFRGGPFMVWWPERVAAS